MEEITALSLRDERNNIYDIYPHRVIMSRNLSAYDCEIIRDRLWLLGIHHGYFIHRSGYVAFQQIEQASLFYLGLS